VERSPTVRSVQRNLDPKSVSDTNATIQISVNFRMIKTISAAIKIAFIILAFALPQSSNAQCDGMADRINEMLKYSVSDQDEERNFAACKVWPTDATKSIVLLARFQKPHDNGEYARAWELFKKGALLSAPEADGLYDLDVLVVKSDSGEIIQHLLQLGALPADSTRLESLTVDTARYTVAPNVRAFGAKADFAHNGGTNLHFQTINLYVAAGSTLKQVLGNLILVEEHNDRVDDCNSSSSEAKRTLAIANTDSNGYADLILREKVIHRESKMVKGKCVENETPSSRQYVLQFDGNVYAVPKSLQYR